MIEITAEIERLIATLTQQEISLRAEELADILWLSVQIESSTALTSPSASTEEPKNESGQSHNQRSPSASPGMEIEEELTDEPPPLPITTAVPTANSGAGGGVPIQVPDVAALRNPLGLARALKPLMKKIPSPIEEIIDESATVRRIATEELWIPILQGKPIRWLELNLVIEKTEKFAIWQQTLREFQQLLERQGAFRRVQTWEISAHQEQVQWWSSNCVSGVPKRRSSYRELINSRGQCLTLVVSDCVSSIWHDGSLLKQLRELGKLQPVSLLQLLPERLWLRTALGWGLPVPIISLSAGQPNSRLDLAEVPRWSNISPEQRFILPVVTLESLPLKNWAKVLAGMGSTKTPGFIFSPEQMAEYAQEQKESSDSQPQPLPSAEARVNEFLAVTSPIARRLAVLLSAVPVSLPVVRLLQQTFLPQSRQVHVAEVFLGGLLESPTTISSSPHLDKQGSSGSRGRENNAHPSSIAPHPDYALYEFWPGVRKKLQQGLKKREALDILGRMSEFIASRLGISVRKFEAMLLDPHQSLETEALPFAEVAVGILEKLGG